ncbi:MAG: hypothetical protein IT209_08815 [Armatimonadetes bacterium]|nr:hypothetical protein [Armatimonadota bacterium]
MKFTLFVCLAIELTACAVASEQITHPTVPLWPANYVFSDGYPLEWRGRFGSTYGDVAAPGVLAIDPGTNWSNFVAAAQVGISHTLANVTMRQFCPTCPDLAGETVQSGQAVALWRPLLHLPVGTMFELTLDYNTQTPAKLPGETSSAKNHREVWRWRVVQDLRHAPAVADLLHSLPFGSSGVPLIGDEAVYGSLRNSLLLAQTKWSSVDGPGESASLDSFVSQTVSSTVPIPPSQPAPSGPGIGIASTLGNPAVATLLAMGESVRFHSYASLGGALRNSPDYAPVELAQDLRVSRVLSGNVWLERADRSAAVRLTGVTSALTPGDRVASLQGEFSADGPERMFNVALLTRSSGSQPVIPMRIRCSDVGGRPVGWITGTALSSSLYNGGLLVQVAGRVRLTGSGFFYLDDGSGAQDSVSQGLRIVLPENAVSPPAGAFVTARGISTHWRDQGFDFPCVVVQSDSDLTLH